MVSNNYLTIFGACEAIGVRIPSPSLALTWRRRGIAGILMPTTEIGNQHLITKTTLKRWIRAVQKAQWAPKAAQLVGSN